MFFHLESFGVKLAGDVPSGFPSISTPIAFNAENLRTLFIPAIAIALLGAVEALSVGKTLAGLKGDHLNGNQEFIAQGFSNMIAGFTSLCRERLVHS